MKDSNSALDKRRPACIIKSSFNERIEMSEQIKNQLKNNILSCLNGANIVYDSSYPDNEPTLRVNYSDGIWDVTLGTPPGNAYQNSDGEYYINIGIRMDSIDWEGDETADEENEIIDQISGDYILERIDEWADDILESAELTELA